MVQRIRDTEHHLELRAQMATATSALPATRKRRPLVDQARELGVVLPADASRQLRWRMIRAAKGQCVQCGRLPCKCRKLKRPGPPSPETTSELHLRLNAELAQSLAQMAELANSKLVPYVVALVESAIADWRSRNIDSTFLMNLNDRQSAPAITEERKGRSQLSSEDREKIREQHDAGMKIPQLAERWQCGPSTIRRVLNCE